MRTGKSVVSLALHSKLKDKKTLIICPAGIILTSWKDNISKWAPKSQVCFITSGKKITKVLNDYDIVIISYDLVQKAEFLFSWAKCVIIDEAHNLKEMNTKKTKFIHRCVFEYSVPRLHLLTGTPIVNRVKEFYSLLALMEYNPRLDKSEFLEKYPSDIAFATKFSYKKVYYLQVGFREIPIIKWYGLRNTDELRYWLQGKYIRFKSEDVLQAGHVEKIEHQISNTQDLELLKEFENYFSDGDNSAVSPEYKAKSALAKVDFTIKYVKDLLEKVDKVVVFCDHVESVKALAESFKVPYITGSVPLKRRAEIANDFTKGDVQVLPATIKTLSEGYDLSRANHIVYNSYPWVPGQLEQASMRIQGYNQDRPCFLHYVLGSPQDAYILKTLEDKIKVIKGALSDGGSKEK
jgi:SNF2 family DNA or RNA helicase